MSAPLPFRRLLAEGRPLERLRAAGAYGERAFRSRYLGGRFEDLCRAPRPKIERLFDFLSLDQNAVTIATGEVVPPPSLGRWRSHDGETVARLEEIRRVALVRFEYLGGD